MSFRPTGASPSATGGRRGLFVKESTASPEWESPEDESDGRSRLGTNELAQRFRSLERDGRGENSERGRENAKGAQLCEGNRVVVGDEKIQALQRNLQMVTAQLRAERDLRLRLESQVTALSENDDMPRKYTQLENLLSAERRTFQEQLLMKATQTELHKNKIQDMENQLYQSRLRERALQEDLHVARCDVIHLQSVVLNLEKRLKVSAEQKEAAFDELRGELENRLATAQADFYQREGELQTRLEAHQTVLEEARLANAGVEKQLHHMNNAIVEARQQTLSTSSDLRSIQLTLAGVKKDRDHHRKRVEEMAAQELRLRKELALAAENYAALEKTNLEQQALLSEKIIAETSLCSKVEKLETQLKVKNDAGEFAARQSAALIAALEALSQRKPDVVSSAAASSPDTTNQRMEREHEQNQIESVESGVNVTQSFESEIADLRLEIALQKQKTSIFIERVSKLCHDLVQEEEDSDDMFKCLSCMGAIVEPLSCGQCGQLYCLSCCKNRRKGECARCASSSSSAEKDSPLSQPLVVQVQGSGRWIRDSRLESLSKSRQIRMGILSVLLERVEGFSS